MDTERFRDRFWSHFGVIWEAWGSSWTSLEHRFWTLENRWFQGPTLGPPRIPGYCPGGGNPGGLGATLLHPDGWIQDTGYNLQHTGYRNKSM